jgi:hypothetical protein
VVEGVGSSGRHRWPGPAIQLSAVAVDDAVGRRLLPQ